MGKYGHLGSAIHIQGCEAVFFESRWNRETGVTEVRKSCTGRCNESYIAINLPEHIGCCVPLVDERLIRFLVSGFVGIGKPGAEPHVICCDAFRTGTEEVSASRWVQSSLWRPPSDLRCPSRRTQGLVRNGQRMPLGMFQTTSCRMYSMALEEARLVLQRIQGRSPCRNCLVAFVQGIETAHHNWESDSITHLGVPKPADICTWMVFGVLVGLAVFHAATLLKASSIKLQS